MALARRAATLRVAADNATFLATCRKSRRGMNMSWGCESALSRRAGSARRGRKRIAALCEKIDSATALAWACCDDHVVPAGAAAGQRTREIAEAAAALPPRPDSMRESRRYGGMFAANGAGPGDRPTADPLRRLPAAAVG